MLNHLKCAALTAAVLCLSLNVAQADEKMHGFNFTSVPTFAELSTQSCDAPQQFVYTLTNSGYKTVALAAVMLDNVDNPGNAHISFSQTGKNDCMMDEGMATLATGESCVVGLSIQACNEGTIHSTLTVKANGVGHVPYPKVAKATINATVSSEM